MLETPIEDWESGLLKWRVSWLACFLLPAMSVKGMYSLLEDSLISLEWRFRPRIDEE